MYTQQIANYPNLKDLPTIIAETPTKKSSQICFKKHQKQIIIQGKDSEEGLELRETKIKHHKEEINLEDLKLLKVTSLEKEFEKDKNRDKCMKVFKKSSSYLKPQEKDLLIQQLQPNKIKSQLRFSSLNLKHDQIRNEINSNLSEQEKSDLESIWNELENGETESTLYARILGE